MKNYGSALPVIGTHGLRNVDILWIFEKIYYEQMELQSLIEI